MTRFNRQMEQRDKSARPKLSDIRYAGAGEQIAALVIMCYHPFTHAMQNGNDELVNTDDFMRAIDPNDYELLILKNTHGPLGDIDIRFFPSIGSFIDPMAE